MPDLTIDYTALRALATRTDDLAEQLARAERISDDTASLVGHDGLAGRVRDFGHSWDVLRNDLAEGLGGLSDAIVAIVETFADIDQVLTEQGLGR